MIFWCYFLPIGLDQKLLGDRDQDSFQQSLLRLWGVFFFYCFYSLANLDFLVGLYLSHFLTAILFSGTSLMLLAIFLLSFTIFYLKWFKSLIIFFISFLIFQSLSPILENLEFNNRAFNLLKIISALEISKFSPLLANLWMRFILDYASYSSIFFCSQCMEQELGINSLYALTSVGVDLNYFADFVYVDIQALKPSSYFTIFLELGLIGFMFTIYFINRFRKNFILCFLIIFLTKRSIFV